MNQQRFSVMFLMIGVLALFASSALADTIYVDVDATGQNDGSSWTDAYTDLQDALADCSSGDEIWVAEGTYTPDDCNPSCDRTTSFELVDGCAVYGGFDATESSLGDRHVENNETILSGDNNNDDPTVTDNAYHVVTAGSDISADAVLDGFTIADGRADGTGDNQGGGGMANAGDPVLGQLLFEDNYGDFYGGAIYNTGDPLVYMSRFVDNTTPAYGFGGAIFIDAGAPELCNCLFVNNGGGLCGGAVFIDQPNTSPDIVNCTFTENYLGEYSGTGGGSIYVNNHAGPTTITNSILWNNDGATQADQIDGYFTSLTVTYSDIQGCGPLCSDPDDYNIDEDPHFTATYYPQDPTHVIDGGNNSAVCDDIDLAGHARTANETVDMGALEVRMVFVDADATGNNDGTSWANAYTDLHDALGDCAEGEADEIWVAEGTYTPDDCTPSCDRTTSFELVDLCAVYGGFDATETTFSDRDIEDNETILSGDNNDNDPTVTDNAYHVVTADSGISADAVLDGFTIADGQADGSTVDKKEGAGIRNAGDPELRRLRFQDNHADFYGGAIHNTGDPLVYMSRFVGNTTPYYGFGGAIFIDAGAPELRSCVLANNGGSYCGGAVFIDQPNTSPDFVNCTFTENHLDDTWGITGGGIYVNHDSGDVTITNSILWNNGGSAATDQIDGYLNSVSITYTDWQGHAGGTGNVDDDPNFTANYWPQQPTDAIDSGNNNEICDDDIDLVGQDRIINGTVDMGALEVRLIYVDLDATGDDDGTSWADGYPNLHGALDECLEGDEIWVAEGTYAPDDCARRCNRATSFELADGCAVYGGFDATETSFSDRDVENNETILSGDNDDNDPTVTDNAYHVVTAGSDISTDAVLDGFTVSDGRADGTGDNQGGGGIGNAGAPELRQLLFEDNHGDFYGGAIYNTGSPLVYMSRFVDNTTSCYGFGGAIFIDAGAPELRSCLFVNNGGGLCGGAVFIDQPNTSPDVVNCTFTENYLHETWGMYGGGIYVNHDSGDITITNSILWNNDGSAQDDQIDGYFTSLTVTYSDIQGCGSLCTDPDDYNIDDDPDFVDVQNGDYDLSQGSPCVDRGDPDFDPWEDEQDVNGDDRVQQCCVDMGSDETPYLGVEEPDPEADGCDKNRYISFEPNNGTREVAFRVTLYDTTLGQDYEDLEGEAWWVQTPDANGIARLGCTAVYRDWSDDTVVHVGDDEIFPESDYDIQAVQEPGEENEDLYSDALRVSTVDDWGDVVGAKVSGAWTCPDGAVNFNDINAVLEVYQAAPSAPPLVQADLDPAVPNKVVNVTDYMRVIAAFQGAPYPFDAPDPCE